MDPEIVNPDESALEAAPASAEAPAIDPGESTVAPPATEDPGANAPASMLEAVKAAIQQDAPAQANSPSAEESAQAEQQPDPDPAQAATDPVVDDAKLPFHKHPRWQEVLKQRNEYKADIERLKPDAEQFQAIRDFQQNYAISNAEMAEVFRMVSLIKTDPMKALEMLNPIHEQLSVMTGTKLPADLQDKVDEGRLDLDDARELARTRGKATLAEQQASQTEERLVQRQHADAAAANKAAVVQWEAQVKQSDPDYARKQSFMTAEAQALIAQHGAPRNPDEAVELVKQAHANVTARLKAILPQKPAARPLTSDQNAASPATKVQPTTLFEAVKLAAQQTR